MSNYLESRLGWVDREARRVGAQLDDAVHEALKNPLPIIETIALTYFLGPAGAGLSSTTASVLANAAVAAANGANMENIALSVASTYLGAEFGQAAAEYLPPDTSSVVRNAVASSAGSAAVSALQGKSLDDVLRSSLAAGVTSLVRSDLKDRGYSDVSERYVGNAVQSAMSAILKGQDISNAISSSVISTGMQDAMNAGVYALKGDQEKLKKLSDSYSQSLKDAQNFYDNNLAPVYQKAASAFENLKVNQTQPALDQYNSALGEYNAQKAKYDSYVSSLETQKNDISSLSDSIEKRSADINAQVAQIQARTPEAIEAFKQNLAGQTIEKGPSTLDAMAKSSGFPDYATYEAYRGDAGAYQQEAQSYAGALPIEGQDLSKPASAEAPQGLIQGNLPFGYVLAGEGEVTKGMVPVTLPNGQLAYLKRDPQVYLSPLEQSGLGGEEISQEQLDQIYQGADPTDIYDLGRTEYADEAPNLEGLPSDKSPAKITLMTAGKAPAQGGLSQTSRKTPAQVMEMTTPSIDWLDTRARMLAGQVPLGQEDEVVHTPEPQAGAIPVGLDYVGERKKNPLSTDFVGTTLMKPQTPNLLPQLTPELLQTLQERGIGLNMASGGDVRGFATGSSAFSCTSWGPMSEYAPKFYAASKCSMLTAPAIKRNPLSLLQIKQMQPHIATAGNIGNMAKGGLPAKYQEAAPDGHHPEFITGLTGYYAGGRGTGQSDDIPAMLHDGDYVIDAEAVSAFGDGSSKAGNEVLMNFMKQVPHRMAVGGNPVPAKIADGEVVLPESFVTALGGGDNKRGARMLDQMRQHLREHKRSAPNSRIPPKAKTPMEYLRGVKG